MYKKVLFLCAAILYVTCSFSQVNTTSVPENTLTKKEKGGGWTLLFDGRSLNGWHSYGRQSAGKAWSVKEGTLHLDAEAKKNMAAGEGGDLVTNEEYGNF